MTDVNQAKNSLHGEKLEKARVHSNSQNAINFGLKAGGEGGIRRGRGEANFDNLRPSKASFLGLIRLKASGVQSSPVIEACVFGKVSPTLASDLRLSTNRCASRAKVPE